MPRLLAFFLLASCFAAAQSMNLPGRHTRQPARSIVSSYCRLDYVGSRLSKEGWDRIKPLTAWRENPDWRGFTVVSQYDVISANEGIRSSSVDVGYTVLGRFERGIGYSAEPAKDSVAFRLKDNDGVWRIEELDPPINPHVSKPAAIAWLKSALAGEKDAAEKIAVEKALKELAAAP
jgi:hypothetical protein